MIAWINFITLIIGGGLMTVLYRMSVRPAALEKKIGIKAYKRCGLYRLLTTIFMFTIAANYVLYHWYPLPFDPFPPDVMLDYNRRHPATLRTLAGILGYRSDGSEADVRFLAGVIPIPALIPLDGV